MNPTTKIARPDRTRRVSAPAGSHGRGRRWAPLTLLVSLLLLTVGLTAPAAFAAALDFTGGPATGDYPIYVPNDHTVCALRFSATALRDKNGALITSAGTYYVKVRLNPSSSPNGATNRGFTWNPTTSSWASDRDAWDQFPQVTTASDGTITAGTTWYFFKFADVTKSGQYYLMVSLQPIDGGSGTTQNSSIKPQVTLLDMSGTLGGTSTPGFWVHNATATGQAGKRVEADQAGTTPVWALMRSVGTGVPTDGTGGNSGDFVLGVPTSNAFDVKLQSLSWLNVSQPLADVNLALGASDQEPPTAPGTLSVDFHDERADLSWGVATDNTAVTSYTVYRWSDPTASGYTSQPIAVHSLAGTSWSDTGLTAGQTYHYMVRASDAATNVGPRSNTVDAVPPSSVTGLIATPGNGGISLTWTNPTTFSGVEVLRKAGSPPSGPSDGMATVVYDGTGSAADDSGLTNGTLYYYAAYAYDSHANFAAAAAATGTPQMVPASGVLITAGDGHNVVVWTNPTASNFAGVKVLRKDGSAPSDANDVTATVVYDGTASSADDAGLTNGHEYFYAVFAYDKDGQFGPDAAGSATPELVPAVSDVEAVAHNASVSLSWSNPVADNFAGLKVLRKAGSAPSGPSDIAATLVYTGSGTSAEDTTGPPSNGTHYYYAAYAKNSLDDFSAGAGADATPQMVPATALVLTPGDSHVSLSWTNPTASNFAGVKVLRKDGSAPSDANDVTATVVYDGTASSADDAGLTNGTHYYYAVFAYDDEAAFAPTAASGDAVPNGACTLTLSADHPIVAWNGTSVLRGTLSDTASKAALAGQTVAVQWLNGSSWVDLGHPTSNASGAFTLSTAALQTATRYRVTWGGDAGHTSGISSTVTVTPKVKLGRPTLPYTLKAGRAFTAYGSLVPKQPAGTKTVTIRCYMKRGGVWVFKKSVRAVNVTSGSATRYTVKTSIGTRGSWKFVALFAGTAKYATTTSTAVFRTVK